MSALAMYPVERLTQMIEASANSLRNDIGTIVIAADAKFAALEAKHNVTISGIITTSEGLFAEVGEKLNAMTAADERHDKHIQQLQNIVRVEIDTMKTKFGTFSDSVITEVQNLRVLSMDHETMKQKMNADLAETCKFMTAVTEHLTNSGGLANGTRDIAMGLVSSHTEIHKRIIDLQNDVKKANVKIQEMEAAPGGNESRSETRNHNAGKQIMEYKGI